MWVIQPVTERELLIETLGEIDAQPLEKLWLQRHCIYHPITIQSQISQSSRVAQNHQVVPNHKLSNFTAKNSNLQYL